MEIESKIFIEVNSQKLVSSVFQIRVITIDSFKVGNEVRDVVTRFIVIINYIFVKIYIFTGTFRMKYKFWLCLLKVYLL